LDPRPGEDPRELHRDVPAADDHTRLGWVSNASASSDVMPRSAPGMSGYHARPPGARRMVFAVTVFFVPSDAVSSTSCGPTTRPAPSNFSTPALSRRRP
jgi:hypothetical protein